MMEVLLYGTFHCIQAAVPDMIEKNWGRIVTILLQCRAIGRAGPRPLWRRKRRRHRPHQIPGPRTRPLRHHRQHHPGRIGRHSAGPQRRRGWARSPPLEVIAQHVPIARPGTPSDIAAACEFLCSDGASYITGQEINVNGGIYM